MQPRGEAVAWAEDGRALLVAGEVDDRLLRVPLPRKAWTATAAATALEQDAASPSPPAASESGPQAPGPNDGHDRDRRHRAPLPGWGRRSLVVAALGASWWWCPGGAWAGPSRSS